ncbi:hypothetical protein [Olleya sp. Hel_I_94]|uniref:hypothetical protein n=1 Tax=Olleya sp. Hel_I_94 TaxID=1250001 RepID=UPI0011A68417|nr:hypothetical protein [Olleya sp. Hel_I_94]TVZ46144.1 hypothetical protein JM82_0712 [Olleya sp. Hel_I_94]
MDYLQIYNENYQFFFKQYKDEFYKFLNNSIDDDKKFKYAFKSLIPKILNIALSEIGFSEIQGSRSRIIVNSSKDMYNTDGLRKVLNSELKEEFESLQKKTNNLFIDYYHYLKSFSCQQAYWDYVEKVDDEEKIINVLYNLKELDQYSFNKTIDYGKVLKEYDFEYYNLNPDDKGRNIKKETNVPVLNKNESFLLWHVLLSVIQESEKGYLIEVGRALVLSNIDTNQLLTDEYKNNNGYKFLTTGIESVFKKENRVKLINDLLHKIRPYKLKKTEVKLKILLRNLA